MPTPIIIIGSARSGTTNLVNQISKFSKVLVSEHEYHFGAIESNVFHHIKKWGDLSNTNQYYSMISQLNPTDYFQALGGIDEEYYSKKYRNFNEFFCEYMDRKCFERQKDFWITKFDPLFFSSPSDNLNFWEYLKARYPDLIVITIKRNLNDILRSYINMPGDKKDKRKKIGFKQIALFLQTLRYYHLYDNIKNFVSYENMIFLEFEKYIADSENALKFCQFGNPKQSSTKNFQKNTSKGKNNSYSIQIGLFDLLFIRGAKLIKSTFLSNLLLKILWVNRAQLKMNYRIYKSLYNIESLQSELQRLGHENLLRSK